MIVSGCSFHPQKILPRKRRALSRQLSDPWLYETSLTVEDESLAQWLDEYGGEIQLSLLANCCTGSVWK